MMKSSEGINFYRDSTIVSWSYNEKDVPLVIIGKARKTGGIDILCSFAGDEAKNLIKTLTDSIYNHSQQKK